MERWIAIPGYEGLYEVSDLGQVRRLGGTPKCISMRMLVPRKMGQAGYLGVGLYRDGIRRYWYIHRLVLLAFVGPCPPGHNVNHRDAIKDHNVLENLHYVTFSGNTEHAIGLGLRARGPACAKGETNFNSRITDAEARLIKLGIRDGESCPKIAGRLGVSVHIVRHIRKGAWAHVSLL